MIAYIKYIDIYSGERIAIDYILIFKYENINGYFIIIIILAHIPFIVTS